MPNTTKSTTNDDLMAYMKAEFKDMKDKSDKWYKEMQELKLQQNNLNTEFLQLKKSHFSLESDVKDLEVAVARLEQAKLNMNMLIRGIPEAENETSKATKEIVTALLKRVDDKSKVKFASTHRIGLKSKGQSRSILVKFQSIAARNLLLSAKKKMSLTCADINVNGKPIGKKSDVIYFGEHLAPLNARLFYIGRQLVKKQQFVHVWPQNGNIFVRKEASSNPLMVCHVSQFSSILDDRKGAGDVVEETAIEQSAEDEPLDDSLVVLNEVVNGARKQTRIREPIPRVVKNKAPNAEA